MLEAQNTTIYVIMLTPVIHASEAMKGYAVINKGDIDTHPNPNIPVNSFLPKFLVVSILSS